MVTLLWPGREFRIKDQEMIKGIRRGATRASLSYHDELVVPIIENTPLEEDLRESLEQAILAYPDTCAVLVRRHGVYVWGESWEKVTACRESAEADVPDKDAGRVLRLLVRARCSHARPRDPVCVVAKGAFLRAGLRRNKFESVVPIDNVCLASHAPSSLLPLLRSVCTLPCLALLRSKVKANFIILGKKRKAPSQASRLSRSLNHL